tara:strand:- start:389 stop:553 length:165 start_codon:yes stop_codon:yes gene_type:complete
MCITITITTNGHAIRDIECNGKRIDPEGLIPGDIDPVHPPIILYSYNIKFKIDL